MKGIPAENLVKNTESLAGFTVLESNYLTALKIFALQQRGRSNKGRKDFIDILAFINSKIVGLNKVKEIIQTYNLQTSLNSFRVFLSETYEIKEISINKHSYSQLKKEITNRLKL